MIIWIVEVAYGDASKKRYFLDVHRAVQQQKDWIEDFALINGPSPAVALYAVETEDEPA